MSHKYYALRNRYSYPWLYGSASLFSLKRDPTTILLVKNHPLEKEIISAKTKVSGFELLIRVCYQ